MRRISVGKGMELSFRMLIYIVVGIGKVGRGCDIEDLKGSGIIRLDFKVFGLFS